jgi:hypothetical protein
LARSSDYPPETALAISLSKRVRELALGLPGLFVWHWIEGHALLRRSTSTQLEPAGSPVSLDDGHRRSTLTRVLKLGGGG